MIVIGSAFPVRQRTFADIRNTFLYSIRQLHKIHAHIRCVAVQTIQTVVETPIKDMTH